MASDRDKLLETLKKSAKEISSWTDVKVSYNGFVIFKQLHPAYVQKETYGGAISLSTVVTTPANRELSLYINTNGLLQFYAGNPCRFNTPEELFDAIDLFLNKNIDDNQPDFYDFLRAEVETKFPAFKTYSEERDKLSYEEFEEINYDELNCIFAETGADREIDFNKERRIEELYESKQYPQLIRYKKQI